MPAFRVFLIAASLFALTACVHKAGGNITAPPPGDACYAGMTPDGVPAVPAGDNPFTWRCEADVRAEMPDALHWARNSLSARAIIRAIFADAARAAEAAAERYGRGGFIVVMDADETVIDNSDYGRELSACGLRHTSAAWCAFTREAISRPMPGAAEFTRRVRELGGYVAIVTNRSDKLEAWTRANLDAAGITYDAFRAMADNPDKAPRWADAAREIARHARDAGREGDDPRPVIWIGDQVTDLAILDAEGNIVRAMQEDDTGEGIGEYLFLIPNPVYGTWQAKPRE